MSSSDYTVNSSHAVEKGVRGKPGQSSVSCLHDGDPGHQQLPVPHYWLVVVQSLHTPSTSEEGGREGGRVWPTYRDDSGCQGGGKTLRAS